MSVVICLLICSTVFQLYFWIRQLDIIYRNRGSRITPNTHDSPSATLIIAVKNELDNLRHHMARWIGQDYPLLEIIIINDHSTDGTKEYLEDQEKSNLRVYHLPHGTTGKKAALTLGISKSNSEWIVTTDADCHPKSPNWIKELLKNSSTSDMIIGYSPYTTNQSWVSKVVAYEAWYIAIQYLSAVVLGRPYMSVGRNLAFKQTLFNRVRGYEKHQDILSGDDDLFVQDVKSIGTLSYTIHPDTWVWTDPPKSWTEFIRQKRRHLSTSPRYEWKDRIFLMFVFLSQLIFYGSILYISLVYPEALFILLIRSFWIAFVAFRSKTTPLFLPVKWWVSPLYDVVLCLLYICLSPLLTFKNKQW